MKYDYKKLESKTTTTTVITTNETTTEEMTVTENKAVEHNFSFSMTTILEWIRKGIALFLA